ncbi:hypothetical protein C6P40_005198 [Pichia californica]|uniref:Karyogamy protein n=1 Tax=Pichia californica TaxID=460514 RepID=A0A9P6WNQ2_9ASCO|nr:hypothetical protein C6P40_005198 [[Candida] californica]
MISLLKKLQNTLENIDKVGRKLEYDINWIIQGRDELINIFQSIDLLEYNVNILLTSFDTTIDDKTESLLDDFSTICNFNLEIKKIIFILKKRLSIINHHHEIEKEVLASVNNEIIYCIEKLSELNEKKNLLNIEKVIQDWGIEDFEKNKKEMNRSPDDFSKFNGLIIFSVLDAEIFETYTSLHETIVPISQSLKIIPKTLDNFYESSKVFYKDLVLKNIEKYESITASYNQYRQDLKIFKYSYITKRIRCICEKIFFIVDSTECPSNKQFEDIIHILRPIENYYGLLEQHSKKLKSLEDKYYDTKLNENIQTPLPKNRKSKSKRLFSNPLADTLNMKPILAEHDETIRPDIKIFQTPRNIDDDIYSKDNIEIIDNIRSDVGETLISNISNIPDTPSNVYSPQSTDSSPDVMRTRNIFDSPDPFITPNSRSFRKSKIPVSTPLTTPRITPTKNYNIASINDTCKHIKGSSNKNNTQQVPLLRFELSTVVKVDTTTKDTSDISNITSITTIPDISDSLSKLSMTPSQIPQLSKTKRNSISPPVPVSRIPLPTRPESRLGILRSVSRLQVDSSKIERKPTMEFNRSDSRLDDIATIISTKHGTDSPALVSKLRMRSATVMEHRDINTFERPVQPNRLREGYSNGLRNLKLRGATSLGARGQASKRISSI